jgi:hypothetical protein
MKSGKTEKFRVNPAKEIVATMVRLARSGIDPGETVPPIIHRLLYHDVNYEGEVVTRLKRHDE